MKYFEQELFVKTLAVGNWPTVFGRPPDAVFIRRPKMQNICRNRDASWQLCDCLQILRILKFRSLILIRQILRWIKSCISDVCQSQCSMYCRLSNCKQGLKCGMYNMTQILYIIHIKRQIIICDRPFASNESYYYNILFFLFSNSSMVYLPSYTRPTPIKELDRSFNNFPNSFETYDSLHIISMPSRR